MCEMKTITLLKGNNGFELPIESAPNWQLVKSVGYSPVQSLVAAVGSCGGYVYADILKNSGIEHTFHQVHVAYEQAEEKPHAVTRIAIVFEVSVLDSDKRRAETASKLVAKYCPVIQSLDKSIQVSETVVFK